MPNIGPLEIAVVLIIALVILGPKKLPEMGSSLGRGMREFKESISGDATRAPDHQADPKTLDAGDGVKDAPRAAENDAVVASRADPVVAPREG